LPRAATWSLALLTKQQLNVTGSFSPDEWAAANREQLDGLSLHDVRLHALHFGLHSSSPTPPQS